jgi:periplasmic glucans biosynthesis protein
LSSCALGCGKPALIAVLLVASLLPRTPAGAAAASPGKAPASPVPRSTPAPPTAAAAAERTAFGFANVRQLAQQRAAREYRVPAQTLPATLANLSYDQYRDIRFRTASALWRGQSLFEVQFFHRGYNVRQRVKIFEVGPQGATEIEYNPRFFSFGRLLKQPPKTPADLGYAGFRVHYPLETPAYKDELLVFLGAAYFRVLGRNQHYGLSARGLAIDTALQSGEEFPTFTDFWLVRPQPSDRSLTVYALLDSRSVAGAYQFDIRPGDVTQVEVHCELYPRRGITKLGMAPLTSMFFYGDEGGRRIDDYRSQVHDSDGLMTETSHGQWIWRPLGNPRELRVNRFIDENPRGFGLIQRDRNFADYQDLESQYQSRPSYWIQPLGNWGKGGVELVEIPSEEEIHDNIVAYWVPEQAPAPGKPLVFAYLLSAFAQEPQWPPGGRVIATRSGNPGMGDNRGRFGAGARRFLVDFAGGQLAGLDGSQPVRAEITADNGHIDALTVQRIPATGSWRAAFVVTPRPKKPVDMHVYLTLYGEVLTETWVYQWTP